LVASSGSLLAASGVVAAVDVLAFAMFDAAVACDVEPLSQAAKDAANTTAQNIYLVLSFFSFVGLSFAAAGHWLTHPLVTLRCRLSQAFWSVEIQRMSKPQKLRPRPATAPATARAISERSRRAQSTRRVSGMNALSVWLSQVSDKS
jgi:hypothetical protein